MLVDTHTHLYLPEFDYDREDVIKNALKNGVDKFYLPSINSDSTNALLDIVEKYPQTCFPMIGLHPCYVKENYTSELAHVADWLTKKKFTAIGECGLDFYWDQSFVLEQYMALEQQINWALQYQLPIVLHTRNATKETIDVIKKYHSKGLHGIFHCFGGTLEEANQIIDLGFLLGIGGVVTYKNAGLDNVLKNIDLKYLVLETDSPYLAPTPFRGKRNESMYLRNIAEKIAEIKNCSYDEVATITSKNANQLFSTHY